MSKSTNYEIKTTLAIDGEKAFKAAMDDANRSMRVMNADLRSMAAEFDYTDDKQRYFAERAELVNEKLKQQDAIVEALGRAVKESGEKYGDASAKTDQYRIQMSNATAKLFEMRKEAENANRELEELGRDSARIGRNIENGIGDAAEDTADKLDSMFGKVQKDVNALKSSVAFQTAIDVGGFVFDSIQSAMGFVQENQEFNMRLAQARTVVEMYGYNWDAISEIINDVASVTGDYGAAQSALVNLAGAGFENEAQIAATVQALLGTWLSSGGELDFTGLAEDYLESVKEKSPTGTYAEAIIKFTDRSVEDVKKVLESMETNADTLEVATAVLTEAGLQTKAEKFKEENKELVALQDEINKTTLKGAEIAENLAPLIEDVMSLWNMLLSGVETFTGNIGEKYKNWTAGLEEKGGLAKWLKDVFIPSKEELPDFGLFSSAGAETLPTTDLQDYGFKAMQEVVNGATSAAEGDSAMYAAVQTILAEADTQALMDQAKTAGTNLMVSYGNGIAAGMDVPLNNVRSMVNQINAMLAQISMPAFGLGWSGITGGNVYLYNQQKNLASTLSTTIGRGAQTKSLIN